MATNLRDRGYGSSMDNYNAHKRKVEERKEQEKTTGPVSTLRLPKVNSTASSRAASTSAPIQTQRFYDPNVTRATPGTGGGRGTPHITEQEFNRSTAMTRSYGNYNNYLKGIHVTGSGFADPDILFKNEPNLKNLETVQNQFDQALNVVSGDFEKKASDYERWYRTITNQYQPMSDAQKSQGDQLYADYMKSLDAYQKMSEAHMKASASNAGVYANVSSQRQKWYDSIRDEKDIDIEEKDLMSQLDLLEDQKYKVQSESSYAKTQTLHGITTAQGLETVMNSTDELDRLDRQIDEVKAQLELLDKERAYSRYFKWQELANNNMPVSARRMQGGAPSWLDKIISGTATEEEIMQAINEGNINPSNIAEMLDDEKQTYRSIYEQYGPAKAKEYVDELERYGNIRDSLNTRRRMTDETKLRNWVQKGSPIGRQIAASVLTVLASPTKVLSYVGQGADYLFSGEMTKDANYNVFSYAPNAVTAQIGENITKWGEEHGNKWVQKWGEFGYQTALSILTFLYTTALTGGFGLSQETMYGVELYNQGYRTAEAVSAYKAFKTAETLSLGLMGTEAAADAVMQAKDRGLDDGQAFWMGTAAGAIEILTEKFSVENLLEGVGDRSRLLSFLKSMFTEGSEEVASDLSNMLVDSLVAKDKSEFNQSVKAYMKEYGVSKQEALKAVWTEQLKSVGLSGLGGAISGGFMGGANIVRSGASNLFNRSTITSPENVANIVNRAQGLNEWSAGARSASALQRKLDAGERLTIREVLKARNAIETDRKTDPKYVGALIEAAQGYGDSDAKKQADKLQTKLDSGKVKVEDVENLEEAIDLERLVDPNREDLQSALKYGETTDQKSEAYVLTKGIRDKIAAGEKLSLEEVSAAESAVSTARATSAEGLKSTIESGLASDQNSPAYRAAQQLQSKLDSGTEITLAEVNEAKQAVRAAENAAYKSLDPNVVGKYLVTENGRKALTDAATILKNSASQSDVRRGNEMLQAIQDGNLDAKTAGEVFLRSQKILENTRNQTARVLQPREVTADMDAYDRSAAELGVSEEEASHNKAIMQAFGVEGEYKAFENNNLSAYYDRSTGKVYINSNAQNPGLALIAHEVTHSFENTAGYKKLADLVFSQSKDLNADLQRITQEYADAGIDLDDVGARSELVSEFVEQHMFNDEKFIKDVVSTDRSLGQKILRTLDNLLAKLGNKNAQQRQLLRHARDLWAEALQQRKTSDKAKAKIAEKRSNGKLTLPAVEAKAAAVRKTEGPKKIGLKQVNEGIRAGLKQATLTAGIGIGQNASGKFVFNINGKNVTKVTANHVENHSAFGALISIARDGIGGQKGTISAEEATKQYQSIADLMNLVMTTQNPEMTWEFAGSMLFSAVKSNSDGQYGTTVDFSTVCLKTTNIINALSERMMALGRGLTKAEVTQLQKELADEELVVPCPVCYVFSRWAGAGSLLDNMKKFQQKYNGKTDAEIETAIEQLRARDEKAIQADIRRKLREGKAQENQDAYTQLMGDVEKANDNIAALRGQVKTAKKNGRVADVEALEDAINANQAWKKKSQSQMEKLERELDVGAQELAWLEQVRTKPGYQPVPDNILFNMASAEAIEEFMTNPHYAMSYRYRTTRGSAMGKAIEPYADMRLGDFILPIGKKSADGNTLFSSPLDVDGEFNDDQKDAIIDAIARVRAQNLIGGQRFQSTSDFRYEYALDYIQAFFEAQALGSNMQTYTKVIEFGEMVARIGGDVNLSVMPRNKGFKVDGAMPQNPKGESVLSYEGGDYTGGYLIYSNKTGIDFGAAKLLKDRYGNAQMILVGINDDHIRLALNDQFDEVDGKKVSYTGGYHVGFVIPYHTSGAAIDTFIRDLVSNLGETFLRENYQDYTDVGSDKVKSTSTKAQDRRRNLRKQLLTGHAGLKNWSPSSADISWMRNFAKRQKSMNDIRSMSFEEMYRIEQNALLGDPAAIREYESWSAGMLYDLYKKMWKPSGAEYGVRLNGEQSKTIMPHEYWDTNGTRDKAYVNNFLFRSYCYNLGMTPRFTGINSSGKVTDHGDFSDCKGYWKTLIDRSMYDLDGKYRAQKSINMSELEVGMVSPDWSKEHWEKYSAKQPDIERAKEIGRRADGKLSLPKAESKQYAISKSDTAYLKAVESGDMETAQRMVDEAAASAMPNSVVRDKDGNLLRMHHGTDADFTVFDRDRIGQRGRFEGSGFNFTPYDGRARGYGKNVLGGYLNIESPLSATKKTISITKLADIIRNIDPTGDNIIVNYARDTNDYGSKSFVEREARTTARAIWKWANNDVDIYSELSAVSPDSDSLIEYFSNAGYDGLIHYDEDGRIRTAVAFDSNQFKLADPVTYDDSGNPIPLSERFNPNNPDIRYAINKDATIRTEGELTLPMAGPNPQNYTKASWARYDVARNAAQYMIDNARNDAERARGEEAMKAAEKLLQKKSAGSKQETALTGKPVEATKRLTSRLLDMFQIEQLDRAELRDYINQFAHELVNQGEVTDDALGQLWARLRYYARGTITPEGQEYFKAIRDKLKGSRIYVDQSTRADFGDDWGDFRKKAFAAGIYLTSNLKDQDIRDMTPELNEAFPERFPEGQTDPRLLLEAAVDAAEMGAPQIVPLDEYQRWQESQTGQSADSQEDELWDKMRRALESFSDAANVEMTLRGRKTIKNTEETEPHRFDLQRDVYRMSDREMDAAIDLLAEPGANRRPVQTTSDLIDSVINPQKTAKVGIENATGRFLEAVGADSDIPGMDKISTGTKRNAKLPAKYKAQEAARFFYRKMVDSGEAVTRLGRYSNDPHLYHYYNMARASSNAAVSMIQDAQTDVMGRRVGDSLNDIFSAIRKKGDQYYADLQAYLYHTHNIDRMSRENPGAVASAQAELEQFRRDNPELVGMADFQIERLANDPISFYHEQAKAYMQILRRLRQAAAQHNKPVFGQEVSAEQSRRAAEDLREKLSETEGFEEDVEKIYQYIDNLMQYRIDSGLITEEEYERLKEIYPHYVPTFREQEPTARNKRGNTTEIGKTVGRAQGGDTRLIPLHRALAQQTFSVVREGSKNRFGQMLLEGKQNSSRGMIKNVEEAGDGFHEDTFDEEDPTPTKENTFIVRQGGKRYEIGMDNALYEAVTALSPEPAETNFLINMVHKSNDLFKALCTGYNPTFLVRNFMRDLQDAGLYSKDLSEFSKNYPLAYKEITTNGKYWQMYKALGGLYSSFFDYQTGELKQPGKVKKYTVDAIESVNMAVEQAPRLAEFMATVKKAEKAGNLSMDTLMEAIYNAADVTVNFGRSGKWGKMFNRSVVPFFNPGVQGFDKMIRNVTETKGFKDWARLAAKATILGIAPAVISRLLFGKRKDWDEIKQRDKDIYYLFPLQDGVWLKLPKGRVLSVFGMAADRIMQGKDADWASFIETSLTQTAPENPLTASYWRPWLDAKLFDKDDPGKTWYGSDIENQRLRNLAPGQRYDTTTDALSKWLGKTFNLSPKKINYLLDQYSGVIGDVLLPLTSDRAEKGLFTNAFTIDSVASNQLSEDFYKLNDELTWAKNDPKSGPEDSLVSKYWAKQTSAVSDINKAIRAIEEDKTLTDKEKRDLVRTQYAMRNSVMRNALDTLDDYRKAAEEAYAKSTKTDPDDRLDEAYREANKNMFGAEYALQTYNKKVYEAATQLREDNGISYDGFYKFYFARQEVQDQPGTSAECELIMKQDMNDSQKQALYEKYISHKPITLDEGMTMDDFLQAKIDKAEAASEPKISDVMETQAKQNNPNWDSMDSKQQKYATWDEAAKSGNDDALTSSMSESEARKYQTATDHGIDTDVFVNAYKAVDQADLDNDANRSYKQEEVKTALDSMDLTNEQRAVLWQVISSAKSGKNNPYDPDLGQQIYDEMQASKSASAGSQTKPAPIRPMGLRLPKIG